MTTIQAVFQGKVQGVGFRATVRRYALHYGIKGYVTNKSDGTVEVVAQSDQEVLDRFLNSIKEFPRGARIKECRVTNFVSSETFSNFVIRHA